MAKASYSAPDENGISTYHIDLSPVEMEKLRDAATKIEDQVSSGVDFITIAILGTIISTLTLGAVNAIINKKIEAFFAFAVFDAACGIFAKMLHKSSREEYEGRTLGQVQRLFVKDWNICKEEDLPFIRAVIKAVRQGDLGVGSEHSNLVSLPQKDGVLSVIFDVVADVSAAPTFSFVKPAYEGAAQPSARVRSIGSPTP